MAPFAAFRFETGETAYTGKKGKVALTSRQHVSLKVACCAATSHFFDGQARTTRRVRGWLRVAGHSLHHHDDHIVGDTGGPKVENGGGGEVEGSF